MFQKPALGYNMTRDCFGSGVFKNHFLIFMVLITLTILKKLARVRILPMFLRSKIVSYLNAKEQYKVKR